MLKLTDQKFTHLSELLHSKTSHLKQMRQSFTLDFTLLYTIEYSFIYASTTRTKINLQQRQNQKNNYLCILFHNSCPYLYPSFLTPIVNLFVLPTCINCFPSHYLSSVAILFPRGHLIPANSQGTCPMKVTTFCTGDPDSGKCASAS